MQLLVVNIFHPLLICEIYNFLSITHNHKLRGFEIKRKNDLLGSIVTFANKERKRKKKWKRKRSFQQNLLKSKL